MLAREHYKHVLSRQANDREVQSRAYDYYKSISSRSQSSSDYNFDTAFAKSEDYYIYQLHNFSSTFIDEIFKRKLENEAMKEENKNIYKRVAEEVSEELSKEIEETKRKAKERIRNNIFSDPEGTYSKSDFVNRDEAYRKRKEREAELIRREDQLNLEEKLFTMMKKVYEVESESKQRDMEITMSLNHLSARMQEQITAINGQMIVMETGLSKRINDLSYVVSEQGLKMDQVAFEAYQNFKYVGNRLDSEVLRLERNDMELNNRINDTSMRFEREVNRLDKNDMKLANDMADNARKFEREIGRLEKNDMELHNRISDTSRQFEREIGRLDKKDMELSHQISTTKHYLERETVTSRCEDD